MHLTWPALESERVLLRKLTPYDAEDVYAYASHPEVFRYLPAPPHRSVGETREYLQRIAERYERGDVAPWAIVLKTAATVIGTCGFVDHAVADRRAELGFALSRPYWGQGLMTEALGLVLDFGFRQMKLNRIEARAHVDNVAAVKVMEGAGMVTEGLLRDYAVVQHQPVSMVVCAILKSDVEAAIAAATAGTRVSAQVGQDDRLDEFLRSLP